MISIFRKNKNVHDLAALTLVEMVVSLGIVMLISTIFIYNYQSNNKRTDLIMAAQVLVSDVHRTENNALGLVRYGDDLPPGGWGLYFDKRNNPGRYIMYPVMKKPSELGYSLFDPQAEIDINKGARIIEFAQGIEISEIRFRSGKGDQTKDEISLSFLPPDPGVSIYSTRFASSTELYVELADLRNGGFKTIFINFLGLAEVID